MVRTNVVVDQTLLLKVMDLYQIKTKREAIDFALRYLARADERKKKTLALHGIGWEADLEETRGRRAAER